jgi:uncharacterized phage protein (TIGR01671 family)
MREIKFRVWDKEIKVMRRVTGFHGLPSDGCGSCRIYFEDGSFLKDYEEFVELMQYTGLKDKNGKEIYEGDIISFTDSGIDKNGLARSSIKYVKGIKWEDDGFYIGLMTIQPLEIIGTIYENPELLENEKET